MAAPFRAPTPLPGYSLPLDRRPSTEHNVVAAYLLESLGGTGVYRDRANADAVQNH